MSSYAKGNMRSSAEPHIFVTGACGAGKSTLAKALSLQVRLPLHRLDDDPAFRHMLPEEPWLHRTTDPRLWDRWQALRRRIVDAAVRLDHPHVIEGTHILTAPDLTIKHRRVLVDTPLHQVIRQFVARDRARYADDPGRYADRDAGAPGSALARRRAACAREIYESLRSEIDAFRRLPAVEIVPRRAFSTWLSRQRSGRPAVDPDQLIRRV